jgi:TPR repeat protein
MTAQNKGSNDGLAVKPNPSEPKKKDIRFALAMFIACMFGGLFVTGWVEVLIGLGVAPLEIISAQIGIALVPFVVGWLIAKVLSLVVKKVSLNALWVASTTLLIVLMLFGQNKSEPSVTTSHDTTAQSTEKTSFTNANTFTFEAAVCANAAVEKQWAQAAPACTAAAQRGDAGAQFNLGQMYRNGQGVAQDYKEGVKWYRLAAAQGDAEAQLNLGGMYIDGWGVAKDDKEAVRWYRLAAAQGLALAQYNLGTMYDEGQGVAQDHKEAVRWYRLAAAQGFALAQHNLGIMYGMGQGVAQDYVRAHMWFNLAAVGGNEKSVQNRGLVAGLMTPEQIARAQEMARQCIAKNYKNCD